MNNLSIGKLVVDGKRVLVGPYEWKYLLMLEIRIGLKDTLDENEIFGIEIVENIPWTRLFIISVMDETILIIYQRLCS